MRIDDSTILCAISVSSITKILCFVYNIYTIRFGFPIRIQRFYFHGNWMTIEYDILQLLCHISKNSITQSLCFVYNIYTSRFGFSIRIQRIYFHANRMKIDYDIQNLLCQIRKNYPGPDIDFCHT